MADFGTLYDYDTAEEIGPATEEQMIRSLAAARIDNGRGIIQGPARIARAGDGTPVYVERLCWVGDIPPEQSQRHGQVINLLAQQKRREESLAVKLREPYVQLDPIRNAWLEYISRIDWQHVAGDHSECLNEWNCPQPDSQNAAVGRCPTCGRIPSMHDAAACAEVTRIEGQAP